MDTFFARFKKVIALVGSDREGERHSAADKAFEMCEENDLSLLEALDGSFGGVADAGDQEALRRKIAELEDANRRLVELEDDNHKLSEALNILNAHQPLSPETGKELLQKLWSYPQTRLLATLLMGASSLWCFPFLIPLFGRFGVFPERMAICTYLLILPFHIWSWSLAEYARRGMGITLVKGVILTAGLALAVIGCVRDATACCVVLSMTAVLTGTNIAAWLLDRLENSDVLKAWFV